MRSLEELKSIDDGGSFDLLIKETEKAANGDELLKLELLKDSVVRGFVDMNIRKAMEQKRLADEAAIVQDAVSKLESKNSSSMKRGFVEVEEDKKKKKKKKTTIKKTNLDDQRLPDPVIPQRFQDEIDKLKGTNVMLVGEKEMTSSDMDTHQGRFSIPRGKVRTRAFLREEDNPKDGVKCSLIQPCLQVITDLEFKKWTMNKTFSYALIKKWNSVACNEKNGLQTGCVVQLWSFRVGLNLWLALVNLDLKQKQGEDNVASSSTGITNI